MSIQLKIKFRVQWCANFIPRHTFLCCSQKCYCRCLWGTTLRCFRRLQSIVSMSKKIYENFVGRLETVRNRQQLSVLEWCRYRDFRLYKKRWISCIVRSCLNPALGAWRCCPQRMSRVKLFHTSECSATLTPII